MFLNFQPIKHGMMVFDKKKKDKKTSASQLELI
jgi:hypothetical protein